MEEFADEQGSLIQVSENSNWENFQRMFPFEAAGSGRVLRVQATPGANPVVELRLKNAAEQEKYNNIVCGMFWHRDQGVGTAFPLTPIYRQKAIWMTCQHVAAGDRRLTMSTNHNLKYSRDAVKHPIKFKANNHLNLEVNDLPYPSEPSQSIHLRDHGDVKAFAVDRYGTADIKLDEYTKFFVPCGDTPALRDLVTCLGYPGILSIDEAQRILATTKDYSEYLEDCSAKGTSPLPESTFLLDANTADQRKRMLDDSTDGVFVSNVLNASPGEVVAATEQLVQYRCSTLPQMLGGPCVQLDKPYKLVAMHIHGGGQLDRNYNFGVSVKHIEFVRAYLVDVLPHLQKKIQPLLNLHPEALDTLRGYFTAVDASVEKLQMRHAVTEFWSCVQELQAGDA